MGIQQMLMAGAYEAPIDTNVGDFTKSAQFRDPDGCYMYRNFVAGNTRLWTFSTWLKLGYSGTAYIGSTVPILAADSGSDNATFFSILMGRDSVDKLTIGSYNLTTCGLTTTAVFRDPSSFYHLVVVMDSNNATVSERIRVYINGVRITAFDRAVYPTTQLDFAINAAQIHRIGRNNGGTEFIDAMIARTAFIGGVAHEASAFGYLNASTDTWVTKTFADIKSLVDAGGVNSCLLEFLDSANFGTDSSTKANNWTPDRLNAADSTIDVPGDSIVQMNQLDKNASLVLADIGRSVSNAVSAHRAARSTIRIPNTGKWYSEFQTGFGSTTASNASFFGLATKDFSLDYLAAAGSWGWYAVGVQYIYRGAAAQQIIASALATTSRVQIAVDMAAGNAWFGRDNVWYDAAGGTTGNPATGANPTITGLPQDLFFYVESYAQTSWIHSGRSNMLYAAPNGFSFLSQKNIAADGVVILSGSFTGNALADGPFVWMNGTPKTLEINGQPVVFGNEADKTANGFKIRTASTVFNPTGTNTWAATIESDRKNIFKYNNAQINSLAQPDEIKRSLRVRPNVSAYMSKAFAAGNGLKWTLSFWARMVEYARTQIILSAYVSSGNEDVLFLWSDGTLEYRQASTIHTKTVQTFKDPSSWYHVHYIYDSAQAVQADRGRFYINGNLVSASINAIPQNRSSPINTVVSHAIGRYASSAADFFQGNLARFCFVDGAAILPDSFGVMASDTNFWKSKTHAEIRAVVDSGGVNSFILDFNQGNVLADYGIDSSVKKNTWTPSGFSVASDSTSDWLTDTPDYTNPILNGRDIATPTYITDAGMTSISNGYPVGTVSVKSGKWVFQAKRINGGAAGEFNIGLLKADHSYAERQSATAGLWYKGDGNILRAGVNVASGLSVVSASGVMRVEFDMDAKLVQFYYNNVAQGSAIGIVDTDVMPWAKTLPSTASIAVNLGQHPWYNNEKPTAGYQRLINASLPDTWPVIISGTFTGNANVSGPVVWMNGVPDTLTINGNAVTWGTHAEKLAMGFKIISAAAGYNLAGANTWSATITSDSKNRFRTNNAQLTP